jgi:hypothetical protein
MHTARASGARVAGAEASRSPGRLPVVLAPTPEIIWSSDASAYGKPVPYLWQSECRRRRTMRVRLRILDTNKCDAHCLRNPGGWVDTIYIEAEPSHRWN